MEPSGPPDLSDLVNSPIMNPLLLAGVVAIFLALFAYTAGVVAIVRGRRVTRRTAVLLTLGLVLDATATACMAALSSGPLTLHGWVGILALAIMAALVFFAWRHRRDQGDGTVPPWLYRYTWVAYVLWLAAFVMGVVLGATNR